MKRLLCLVLALLCVGIFPLPAAATETEQTPVPIETAPEPAEPEDSFPVETAGETEPEAETIPETVPEERIPEETEPATTEPEISQEPEEPRNYGSKKIQRMVPLYLQTDYPNAPYGGTTVAKSGCGMTSLAMVASYLLEEEISPAELALRYGNYDASHVQRVEAASIVLDLPYEQTTKWNDVVKALEDGKLVIALMNADSCFTATQHFIVLVGITPEGKILVNDPYGPNYDKWELAEGFKCGFAPEMVSRGFSGAWIYTEHVPSDTGTTRYPDITLSQRDKDLLASIIWLEARGECFEGQQAIAEIVFNRMSAERFPDTLRGVIFAEGQFRTVELLEDAQPGELQYKAIECALTGTSVLPMEVVHFATYPANEHEWGRIGGHIFCYDWDYIPAEQ